MKVLLITFSFPPAGGVGVLRALSLAKYLPASGVELHVLTARNAPSVGRDESLLRQIPEEVHVHRTWTLDLPFRWRKGLKRLLGRGKTPAAASKPSSGKPSHAKPGLAARLRAIVANLLLPDPQIGWLPFARPAARRLIRRYGIDAVIITVPPFSTLRLVSDLRRRFPRLPVVADFRDEWISTTLGLVSFNSNQRARQVAEQTESATVRDATAVVAVTEAAVRELRGRYPQQSAAKFLSIPNGFDAALPAAAQMQTAPRTGTVSLIYMGTVYGSTAPESFAAALRSLSPELRDRLSVRFIGHIETEAHRSILAELAPTVELCGFLPQAEALAQLQHAAYLLLISHDPINVSAKFYDYLGAGRPILAALHPAGDVRRILDETRGGWWADVKSPEAIAALLTQAVNRSPQLAYRPDLDAIAAYHRRPLAARYAALLKQLVQAGHA